MNQRNKVLLIGALAGAATGLVAAMMLQRRAERTGSEISLSTGEGIQLGMMILGLVRSIATLADKEDRR
jgi:phage protein U